MQQILKAVNTTQEKIIALGRDFIQSFGYHAFNFRQIAEKLNVKNAAIHHYYRNKEDLGVAVIEQDKSDFENLTKVLSDVTATEKVNAILDLYRNYFNSGRRLCMISTCGTVYDQLPVKMQMATKAHLNAITSWLRDVFQEGLNNLEFNFSETADEMALRWTSVLPGMLITGRINGQEKFESMMNLFTQTLYK